MTDKRISVVIPCYNEKENILNMYNRLINMFKNVTKNYEIIFVNNGSLDGSNQIFDELTQRDNKVVVIELSRNFGSSGPAYTCGLEYATGDAVVMIDGDIQDPPELIAQMVEKWLEGFDVVYGTRKKRKDRNIIRKIGYKIFYMIFKRISYVNMPLDAGDFGLMDRKVVNIINSMPETNRFIRGMRAWAGFNSTGIEYCRSDREAGKTKYSLLEYVRAAKLGLFSFSYVPLEYISHLAWISTIVSIMFLLYNLIGNIVNPNAPKGFATLIVTMLFVGSVQLLALSVIGEYLGKIFDEVKRRPEYVIKKVINDPRDNNAEELFSLNLQRR